VGRAFYTESAFKRIQRENDHEKQQGSAKPCFRTDDFQMDETRIDRWLNNFPT